MQPKGSKGPDAGCVRCSEWPGGLLIWMAGFTPREGSTAVSEKQQRNVAWGWAALAGCIVVIIATQRTRAATR